MNQNQVNGSVKDIAAKIQEQAGKLVGNQEQRAQGLLRQVQGKTQKALGDLQQTVEHITSK